MQEEQELHRIIKATSEQLDVVKRAHALLAVQAGQSFTDAARAAGYKSGDSISLLVERFHQHRLSVLLIAPGRGRKPTDTPEQRAQIIATVQRQPDRVQDHTATWSLMLLRHALRNAGLPHIASETVRETLHEAGYAFGKTRTWCPTGTAQRKRKAGVVTVHDPAAPEKKVIEQAYEQAEAAGLELWNQDEAGPYQAIPHEGENGHPAGKPRLMPHAYLRGGTAKLLTLFRPATGQMRAKGVLSAPNVVLHPWLKEQFLQEWKAIERRHPAETLPADRRSSVLCPMGNLAGSSVATAPAAPAHPSHLG